METVEAHLGSQEDVFLRELAKGQARRLRVQIEQLRHRRPFDRPPLCGAIATPIKPLQPAGLELLAGAAALVPIVPSVWVVRRVSSRSRVSSQSEKQQEIFY